MAPRFAIPLPSNASFDELERRAWVEGGLDRSASPMRRVSMTLPT